MPRTPTRGGGRASATASAGIAGLGGFSLFAGPIIAREVLTAPRPLRFYVARATYVGLLFVLMWTAWQVLIGFRQVQEFGIIARFGGMLFQIFVFVQLTLILFFAPLAAATAVA